MKGVGTIVWIAVALLVVLGIGMLPSLSAAPTVLQQEDVYQEDFTAYTYKDYVENAEWDIWAGSLRLAWIDNIFQYSPAAAVNLSDGSIFVVWQDARGGYDIYAQKLDKNGNRLWMHDVRVNSDGGTAYQGSPAVAVDNGGNAVVVWKDKRSASYDIYAQRLEAGGNKLWVTDLRVNSDDGTAHQGSPAVAVDSDGNAIVVWSDRRNDSDDVYAQRLDVDSNKLWTADLRVNSDDGTADQRFPAVAVDSGSNVVVVWDDRRNGDVDIYAQRLDAAGNKLWAADLRVNSDDNTVSQGGSAVAVDSSDNAVVVWQDRRNGDYDIYAQRLDATANKLWAGDLCVHSDESTAGQEYPTVAADNSGDAVVVWRDDGNGDIYAQRLDAAGNKLWAANLRVNSEDETANQFDPAVVVDGSGIAVVVWGDVRNVDEDIYAQRLDTAGNKLWVADLRVNSDNGPADQGSPAVAVDSDGNAVVVWQDKRHGNYDIYAQRLDAAGNKLWAADLRISSDGGTAYGQSPAVALDSGGNAVVLWQDSQNGDIYAQRLDSTGNKLWAADLRVNSDSGTAAQWSSAMAVDGSGNAVVVWGDSRNGNWDIYTQRLDTDGSKLWVADLRVNSDGGTEDQGSPHVAVDSGGNAVFVWDDYRNGNYDIYAQRLDTAGNRLWAADLRVNSYDETARQHYPAVAIDSSGNALVAWQDLRNDYGDIYAQRLDTFGTKLWAADLRVNSDSGMASQGSPAVTTDSGRNTVVVWGDERNDYPNDDIYAQRLDTIGNKLWAADLRVNSDDGIAVQDQPGVAVDSNGIAFIVWSDGRNANWDICAQRINAVGGKAWLADLQVVYPDQFHFPTGTAQSRTVGSTTGDIRQATITANYQANGGSVQFSLTNDGGAHWAEVIPGLTHVFTTTGSDLRWKAVLNTDSVWNRTPVVHSLRIDYSTELPGGDDYESDDTCAQAQPIQVNGAAQQHSFHQQADADWAWFNATAGTTCVVQTAHTGPDADTVLELHDACDQPPFDSDDNPFGAGASITFEAPTSGTYYVNVHQHDPAFYGEDTGYELSVRAQAPSGAAVIVAGRLYETDASQPIINATANLAYQTFLHSGFSPDNIQYLNSDLTQPGVDGVPSWENVRAAIQDWARVRVGLGIPLWVYLADHGNVDRFHNEVNQAVTAADLNLWLSNVEATSGADQINVIIDACHSGSFIDTQWWDGGGLEEISGHGRVVVTSTTTRWFAYSPPIVQGQPAPLMYFSDGFWRALGQGQDVWNAFLAGRGTVEAAGQLCGDYAYTCQKPWLDDNGDAWFDTGDGLVARGRGLAAAFGEGAAPYIDWVEVGPVAGGQATVRAQVRDDGSVARVWARVFAPSFAPPESPDGSTPIIEVPEVELSSAGGDVYQAEYGGFTEEGAYQVVVYALDDEGNSALPRWVWTGRAKIFLPLVMRNR